MGKRQGRLSGPGGRLGNSINKEEAIPMMKEAETQAVVHARIKLRNDEGKMGKDGWVSPGGEVGAGAGVDHHPCVGNKREKRTRPKRTS